VRAARIATLLFSLASACAGDGEARPQWTVTIRTDAPLPLVGDRLLVEVTTPTGALACEACTRLFDGHPETFPLSFGVAASRAPLRLRIRLHRARAVLRSGAPDPGTTIDRIVTLPATPGAVHTDLLMRCFGLPSTASETCDATTGELGAIPEAAAGRGDDSIRVGGWSFAQREPCADAQAPDGMLCGPAGLFFFGSLRDPDEPYERLTYLSPFFLDVDELSVGRARALIRSGAVTREPRLRGAEGTLNGVCTYLGKDDPSSDAMPLNCVERSLAAELCAAEGKTLPTEAQLAAVATNGASGSRFPWGEGTDVCARAIVARSTATIVGADAWFECRRGADIPFGPVPVGPTLDVTFAPAGFRNLAGNVSEWVSDGYTPLAAPFWQTRPLLVDPRAPGPLGLVRGGSWQGPIAFAQSYERSAFDATGRSPDVGLRCAKAAR
jgi:formylglycine-generating enzyme required for sulfatase activity